MARGKQHWKWTESIMLIFWANCLVDELQQGCFVPCPRKKKCTDYDAGHSKAYVFSLIGCFLMEYTYREWDVLFDFISFI